MIRVVKIILKIIIFCLVIVLLPGLPPKSAFPFEEFSFVRPSPLTGPFAPNEYLNNAERLFEGKLVGPEHLLAKGDTIYTSLGSGEVVKIIRDEITFVAKFGEPCSGKYAEHICGRPLGMNFDTQGNNLIVADAYYGIFEVNLKSGEKKRLVAPDDVIGETNPRKAKLFNSVAVAKNGDIYWTDSSSDFGLNELYYEGYTNPSGRLIHHSRSSGKNTVILDKLWFANGVALPGHEEFVIVSDLLASRLQKCHLKGAKKGSCEIFIEGLPGIVDNLTPDEDGIWLPIVKGGDPENPFLFQKLADYPLVRKFLIRLTTLVKLPFEFLEDLHPNIYTQMILFKIRNFSEILVVENPRTTLIRVDWNGKVVQTLHGFDQSVHTISHVLEHKDHLYLGSPWNNYIGRVKLVNKDKIHPKS